jgi:UDP-N-acetylglucosamine--N-acetylmuramyl-(pentapeptide) pyrophosphoryl-undecaprenol N-acetylglucosamine transferase
MTDKNQNYEMIDRSFIFAGGGTGGHIYPAIAVAEQIVKVQPTAKIRFLCSSRSIDAQILAKTGFDYTILPAKGFSIRPGKLVSFCTSFLKSYKIAGKALSESKDPIVIGVGGFVAAPVCLAAYKRRVPIALLNVDIVPGRANKLIARWANEIFVQFEDTVQYFAGAKVKVSVVGCPLRNGFSNPQPQKVIEQLGLDKNKKVLLITGASSGAENINEAMCLLLEKLDAFADNWQIVHLTGVNNFEKVNSRYSNAKVSHKVLGYFDDMPDLLAAAELVVGRSGAVSVAEYAAAAVPSICIPYPYHKDKHQYLNARKLVDAGAAVIAEDVPWHGHPGRVFTGWKPVPQLWRELEELMKNENRRQEMKRNCRKIARKDAAAKIAERLGIVDSR